MAPIPKTPWIKPIARVPRRIATYVLVAASTNPPPTPSKPVARRNIGHVADAARAARATVPVIAAAMRIGPIPHLAESRPLRNDETVYPPPNTKATYPRSARERSKDSATDGHVTPGIVMAIPRRVNPKARTKNNRLRRITCRGYLSTIASNLHTGRRARGDARCRE